MSSSCEWITAFTRRFPNLYIIDELSNSYFYRGQDQNSKEVLIWFWGVRMVKALLGRLRRNLRRSPGATESKVLGETHLHWKLQLTDPLIISLIRWCSWERKMVFVLKRVGRGVEKVNIVNYFTWTLPLAEDCYYEEAAYSVNDWMEDFQSNAQGSNMDNWRKGKENQGSNYGNYNQKFQYIRDGELQLRQNYDRINCGNRNDRLDLMFLLKIRNQVLGKIEVICYVLKIWCWRWWKGSMRPMRI